MRWKIQRYSKENKLLHEYNIHANNIMDACKFEGRLLTETELAIIQAEERISGKTEGTAFIQKFESGLPENLVQHVFISPN